jgi:hypothetical protein
MQSIDIYEPAAGCLTGACGPDQEEQQAAFEAALDALRLRGVKIHRYNLGHDPGAFASQPIVKAAIRQQGMAGLPVVLIDGQVASQGQYPGAAQLTL